MTYLDATLAPRDNNTWVLRLSGTIDASTQQLMWSTENSAQLIEKLTTARIETLIIDIANVDRIDSQGLGVLLSTYKEFYAQNISVVLLNPNPHLARLFRLMQFDQVFTIESSSLGDT